MGYAGPLQNTLPLKSYHPQKSNYRQLKAKDGPGVIIQDFYLFHFLGNSLETECLKVYAFIKLILNR